MKTKRLLVGIVMLSIIILFVSCTAQQKESVAVVTSDQQKPQSPEEAEIDTSLSDLKELDTFSEDLDKEINTNDLDEATTAE